MDHVTILHRKRLAAFGQMLTDFHIVRMRGEPRDTRLARAGFFDQQGIVGIQYQPARAVQCLGYNPLQVRQRSQIVEAELAEMVLCNIGDQGRIRALQCKAAAQESTSSGLENRDLDASVAQYRARAAGTRVVTALDDVIVDGDPVR